MLLSGGTKPLRKRTSLRGPNGGRVSLYAVSPSCPRRGESDHDKPGRREERLEKPGAPGQPFYFTARQMPTDDCLGEQLQACRDGGPLQQQVPGSALFRSDRFSRRRAEGGGQRARSMVVTERLRPRPRRTSRDQFVTPPPSCLRSQTRGLGIQSGWGGEPQPASTALVVPFLSHARCMWHPACRRKEAFQIAGRITARHTTQCSSWRAAISEI